MNNNSTDFSLELLDLCKTLIQHLLYPTLGPDDLQKSSLNSSFSSVAIFSPNEAITKNHKGLTFLQDKEGYREGDATSLSTLLKARKTKKPQTVVPVT